MQSDISSIGIDASVNAAARDDVLVDGKPVHSSTLAMVDLAVGDNVIAVTVTGRNATTFVYSLHVTRENIRPVADKFLMASYTGMSTGITLLYRLFVPDGYDSTRSYPLVVFLHGARERGMDNEAQLTANQGATVWAKPEEQTRHPCFVLAPQCPGTANSCIGWTTLMSSGLADPFRPRPELETVFDLIQQVSRKYAIDRKRTYCTGLSMGGFGAWALALSHPDALAAIVVASGGGDPAKLAGIARLPVWIFHAVKDPVVPVSFARATVKTLMTAGGAPRYTEYPQDSFFYPTAHESWVPAFSNAEMREWLFQQSRP